MKFIETINVYFRHPKCIKYDIKFYIRKCKGDFMFWLRRKLIRNILDSEVCSYQCNVFNGFKPFKSSILFPCSVVSMVLLEHFKRVDLLGIHSISVDTQRSSDEVYVTISLNHPGFLIGRYGEDFDHVRKRLSEIFGIETQIDIEEIHDVNEDKMSKYY